MRYANLLYFVLAAFILVFGVVALFGEGGKLWANIAIILIGLYFLYRGVAITVNARNRRLREADEENDQDNA